jgi:hypothetical protein
MANTTWQLLPFKFDGWLLLINNVMRRCCRLRGFNGARRDGLNFPEERYVDMLPQLAGKTLEQVIAELKASGVTANALIPEPAAK